MIGRPVVGAPEPATAPELGAGQYTTTITADKKPLYFSVAKSPGWISATARPPSTEERTRSQLALVATDISGKCSGVGGEYTRNVENTHNVIVANLLIDTRVEKSMECAEAGRVLVGLGGSSKLGSRWPVELTIIEEPAVESTRGLPGPDTAGADVPISSDWRGAASAERVVGATTLSEAPVLEAGAYADTIVPGERLVYRIPADYGQRVHAEVFIPKATPALAAALPVERGDHVLPIYGRMYGPNQVDMTIEHGIPHGLLTGVDDAAFALVSPQVRYLNRSSDDNRLRGAAVEGDYYIEVNTPRHGDQTYAIPLQIKVAVEGDPAGKPAYAGLLETAEPTPSSSPAPTAEPADTPPATPGTSAVSSSDDQDQAGDGLSRRRSPSGSPAWGSPRSY